tara:strand:- start:7169 stop:7378 length:210 start_codon:yes stop_codon:yes gene_type:complete
MIDSKLQARITRMVLTDQPISDLGSDLSQDARKFWDSVVELVMERGKAIDIPIEYEDTEFLNDLEKLTK